MRLLEYTDYVKTLKEISIDTSRKDEEGNSIYMTSCLKEAVDFDDFLEKYFKMNNEKVRKPESVDVYCLLDEKPCFIEFKNGKVDRKNVHNKVGHSLAVALMNENIMPREFREKGIFILVYNREAERYSEENSENFAESGYLRANQSIKSPSLDKIYEYLGKKQKEPIVLYGLNTYKGTYFAETMTMDKEIFNQYIEEHDITIP